MVLLYHLWLNYYKIGEIKFRCHEYLAHIKNPRTKNCLHWMAMSRLKTHNDVSQGRNVLCWRERSFALAIDDKTFVRHSSNVFLQHKFQGDFTQYNYLRKQCLFSSFCSQFIATIMWCIYCIDDVKRNSLSKINYFVCILFDRYPIYSKFGRGTKLWVWY